MEFSELEVLSFLIAAGQVFIMVPGLALFYGGLVRHKNVIGTMMHSITAISVVSVLWVLWGYSLAFGNSAGGLGFVGDLSKFGMVGVPLDEQSFMVFQGMFAVITVALISGGFAERFKFPTYVVFAGVWVTARVRPPGPLGLGRGLVGQSGQRAGDERSGIVPGLRRRNRRTHRIGLSGVGGRIHRGAAHRFRLRGCDAPQRAAGDAGGGPAVVRVVRIQRGQQLQPFHRGRRQCLCRHQHSGSRRNGILVGRLVDAHQATVRQRGGGRRGGRAWWPSLRRRDSSA